MSHHTILPNLINMSSPKFALVLKARRLFCNALFLYTIFGMFSFLPDTFGFRTLGRTCFFLGRHGAYLAKSHFPQTATRFKSLVRQVNVKFTPVPIIFPSQTRKSCKILTGTGTGKNLANLEGKTVLTEFWSYIYYLNVKPRCGVQVEM